HTFPDKEPTQTAPIVYDGTLYASTAHYTVALDGASCKVVWQSEWKPRDHETYITQRGAAIKDGKLVRGTRGRLSPGAGRQDRQRAVVAADCEAQRRLFHQHAAADLRGPRADRPGRV